MDDQHFHEVRPDGFVDRRAIIGLLVAGLLFAAAIVVYLI